MLSKDKAEMAWRHRSRQEKLLLRVIAFLSFVLAAFIITVIAMDLAYKSEIKKLEDEVQALKSTPTIVTTSTEVVSTLSTSSTSSGNTTAPTEPLTTTPMETTADSSETTSEQELTTTSDDVSTTEEVTTPDQEAKPSLRMVVPDGLVQALRALLTSFSKGSDSYNSVVREPEYRTDTRRTRGSFILLADLLHEETPNQILHGEKNSNQRSKETVEIMKLQNPKDVTSAPLNQTVNNVWNESQPIITVPSIIHDYPRVTAQLLPSPTIPNNPDPTVSHSIDSTDEEYRRFSTTAPTVKRRNSRNRRSRRKTKVNQQHSFL